MKKRVSGLSLCFVFVFFVFALFMSWYIPSISSVSARIAETKQDLETSEGRERKQQEEYDKAVEELPLVQQELAEKNPVADEAEQKVADLKARRKELRAEKKALEDDAGLDKKKEGSSDGE